MSGFLNERQAAAYLRISVEHMRDLRCRGIVRTAGYVRVRTPIYDRRDLDEFLVERFPSRTYRFGRDVVTVVYDEPPDYYPYAGNDNQ